MSAEPDQPWMDTTARLLTRRPRWRNHCPDQCRSGSHRFGLFPLRNGGPTIEHLCCRDYFGLSDKIVQADVAGK